MAKGRKMKPTSLTCDSAVLHTLHDTMNVV